MALDADGYVYVFGSNTYGQLGLGDILMMTVITKIPHLPKIVCIACGYNFSIIVSKNGMFMYLAKMILVS